MTILKAPLMLSADRPATRLATRLACLVAGFAIIYWIPLIGLGDSHIVPVFFRRAGTQTTMPTALAVGSINTAVHAGHFVGTGAIGLFANAIELTASFWILAGPMALVPLTARFIVGRRS